MGVTVKRSCIGLSLTLSALTYNEAKSVLLLIVSVSTLISFVVSSSSGHSECARKAVIFNFGDSNSDTGGFSLGYGIIIGPPTGRAFFNHPTGRFSDGRLILDFLCQSINISYLTPFMQSVKPNFTNGANFAVSGACTLPERKPFNLDVQIGQFLQFRARSIDLISKGFKDLLYEEDFNNALYMIDIGQNDLAYINLPYEQVLDQIPSFIYQIQSSILKLYQNGGKYFWVHNTGPTGCLPQILAINNHSASDLDKYGCMKSMNNAAKEFNKQLFFLCERLRSELNDATIVYVDIYSIKFDVITNPVAYGFENPVMACCGYGGRPYNYKVNRACGVPGYNICNDGTKYVSWDGVHHSEAANAVFASKILSTNYSTPKLRFYHFCKT